MTSWKKAFTGEFLSGADCDPAVTTKVNRANIELVESEDGDRQKLVVYLDGLKPWIPSKTGAICMDALFGEDIEQWPGHLVTLFYDRTVRFGTDVVGGIRVKGSPELKAPKRIQVKLRKRKPFQFTLEPTATTEPETAPAPEPVDLNTLDEPKLNKFLASKGLPGINDLSDKQARTVAARLAAPENADTLANLQPQPETGE